MKRMLKVLQTENISGLSCTHSQISHFSFKSDVTRAKLLARDFFSFLQIANLHLNEVGMHVFRLNLLLAAI